VKFYEIIKKYEWSEIENILLKLYPDQSKSIDGYQQVFNQLKSMKKEESLITIIISKYLDYIDNSEQIDVSGKEEGDFDSLALEYTAWEKWLGMNIDEKTLADFAEVEIISHALYEMTFFGFDNEEIQKEFTLLKKEIEECKETWDDSGENMEKTTLAELAESWKKSK